MKALCKLAGGLLLSQATWHWSTKLHIDMLEKIVRSPISFFDSTARGKILNRFTADLETNDVRIFVAYKQLLQNIFCFLGRQVVIGSQAPIVFGIACVTEIFLVFVVAMVSNDNCLSGDKDFGCGGVFTKTNFERWPCHGAVEFHHYNASYRPGTTEDAIKDLSFSVQPGEKVAIVGRTGAGKSSIILALLRMIPCTSGSVTIDGIDISCVPLKTLRSAISVIHQDPSLWSGTLRENLDPECCRSDREIWTVLQRVDLSTLVEKTVGGLSLVIGEKGENLSVGQRQLVSLARALLRGTKILVLDEATSQIDLETDRRMQETLRVSFAQCAVITVAHRIDTILDYDRVVVMGEGRVLEYGPVRQLLTDQSSTFRSLVQCSGIDPDMKVQDSQMK
ncbi:multidrug resistance protein mrp-7-like [Dermacentor variabilis]|uniref:multidrug resistance protein mrp-7-like n=1 Tax=Dermacentor variabilis TaxID=34621 RepID=UPI003F5C726E